VSTIPIDIALRRLNEELLFIKFEYYVGNIKVQCQKSKNFINISKITYLMTDNLAFLGDSKRVKLRISSHPFIWFFTPFAEFSSNLQSLKGPKYKYKFLYPYVNVVLC
jgi:hypothetical protein